jgi:NADH:ubiquinone oxidoreductase subunit 5 (subunit L)/multisubunit Na+/H+ antiporter MnhA subunit
MSTPPFPLLAIFGIVISLLWLSHYTGYEAQLRHSAVNLQIFLFLLPILLILFMASYSTNWLLYYRLRSSQHDSDPRSSGSFPWGIAIFVVVLLMLLSYRSTFHSKWFGLLQGSD